MTHLHHHGAVFAVFHVGVDGVELRLLIRCQDGVDLRFGRQMRILDLLANGRSDR